MKLKKRIIFIILATLIVARVVIMMMESHEEYKKKEAQNLTSLESTEPDINSKMTVADTPKEAMTTHQDVANKDEVCLSMKDHYQNLDTLKKTEKVSVRFVNVHKKVDGIVYRTRLFYKDSSENEILTYLLYKEDNNDEPVLIEKNPYRPGKQYQKIEKALGEILYTEEGVNIGVDQDLFLHYENKVLKDLQGISPLKEEKDFIECRF